MNAPDPVDELALLVRSRHGLAVLEVDDEDRAEALLRHLADRLGVPCFRWTRTAGLVREGADGPVYNTQEPVRALAHIQHAAFPAVYHFRALGPFLQDATTASCLADAARPYEENDGILVLTGDGIELPESVRRRAATVRIAPPGDADYHQLMSRVLRDVRERQHKEWLAKRRSIINEPARAREFGFEFPKGVVLVGVPGSGKSLCAKAVATEWTLPLLKLDPAGLYNKYVGETEKNFRRAMAMAERMAPVVLWIDEIEKAFAEGGGEDGGVSTRVLGTFLSWLQERKGDVFVVATANAVEKLPPELLRKGRFDDVFFVDLPDQPARRAIFRIHLNRRNQPSDRFDLDALARATDGFSGAEIEQVILSALYSAFADGGTLDDDALLAEIRATSPLSVVAAERVTALRTWAQGRTVRAN